MSWRLARAALATALLLVTPGACGPVSRADLRVVLITLDTLRYDSLAGGADRPSDMPATLAWAKERALRFERFFAATTVTAPSHATIFTGLDPWQHGVTRNRLVLADEHETLAERLSAAGFSTAAVVASPAASSSAGLDQGFERFVEAFPKRSAASPRPERGRYALAGEIERHAFAELDRTAGGRSFLWLHFVDPHTPYGDTAGDPRSLTTHEARQAAIEAEDPEAVFRRVRELYSADVRVLDAVLARVLERLDRDAERIESHIVITADHGESLGEDWRLGHGRHLTEPVMRVPALIASPRVAAGARRDVAGSIDLYSTLLGLAGVEGKTGRGRDLVRQTKGSGAAGMRQRYDYPYRDLRSDGTVHIVDSDLVYWIEDDGVVVRSDCERLVYPSGREISSARRERDLSRSRSICAQLATAAAPPVADSADAELRALGYLQ